MTLFSPLVPPGCVPMAPVSGTTTIADRGLAQGTDSVDFTDPGPRQPELGLPTIPTSPSTTVTLHIGDVIYSLTEHELGHPDLPTELRQEIAQSAGQTLMIVPNLPNLEQDSRLMLLGLAAEFPGRCRLQFGTQDQPPCDPFQAVLASMRKDDIPARTATVLQAALEAAAVFHRDNLEAAGQKIIERCQELGIRTGNRNSLFKQLRQLAGKDKVREEISVAEAASAYLKSLSLQCGLSTDRSALRYFQEDFYCWEDGCWVRQSTEELKAQIVRFLQRLSCGRELTTRFVQDVLTNLKGLCLLGCWKESMPFLVEQESPTTIVRANYAVFTNGLIDLDQATKGTTPEVLPHDWRYFSSVRLPFAYDPAARCPLWLQTLDEIFPSLGEKDRRIEVLQEFMGWTLFARDMGFQKFLILVGKGSNGKSTLLSVWEELLGSANVSHVPLDRLAGEFRLYEMDGKMANIAGDMNHLDQVAEGILKQLTSGDPIQVNRKHRSTVSLRPTARMIFATNHLPSIIDRSDGVWRRMLVLPFKQQFSHEQIDPRRVEKLRTQLPGIFNWALAGAIRLYQQEVFTACELCSSSVEEHRHHCDPFKQFVAEECTLIENRSIRKEELYKAYSLFCQENGRQPKNSAEFGKWVLDLPGVRSIRESNGDRKTCYVGICLTRDCPRPQYSPPGTVDHSIFAKDLQPSRMNRLVGAPFGQPRPEHRLSENVEASSSKHLAV